MYIYIDRTQSVSGIQIGVESYLNSDTYMFYALCPSCSGKMVYLNSRDPFIRCHGTCGTTYESFNGIPRSKLLHGGPWKQVFSYQCGVGSEQQLADWISRWTGLEITVELE